MRNARRLSALTGGIILRSLLSFFLACLFSLPLHARADTLTVSAAASLVDALKEIASSFESRHSNVQVVLNFGASGTLLHQIAQGAPVDVFISADSLTMDKAQEQHLIDATTRRDFAQNSLVLISPLSNGRLQPVMNQLGALTHEAYERVALGRPETVPAGRYAKAALKQAGIWQVLQARLIYADSVRQVLDYVRRGEVDAGFVYASDAAIAGKTVQILMHDVGDETVGYPAAVTRDTKHPALAAEFLEFLSEPASQTILERHGFRS